MHGLASVLSRHRGRSTDSHPCNTPDQSMDSRPCKHNSTHPSHACLQVVAVVVKVVLVVEVVAVVLIAAVAIVIVVGVDVVV